MVKLYTKQGDLGQTTLWDGTRVSKASAILELVGTCDQLISEIGFATHLNEAPVLNDVNLFEVLQVDLMAFNTFVATPTKKTRKQEVVCSYTPSVETIEVWTDFIQEKVGEIKGFVLPRAYIHVPRNTARRLERIAVNILGERTDPVTQGWLKFLNRISDFLFICALFAETGKYKLELTYWGHPAIQIKPKEEEKSEKKEEEPEEEE